MKLTTLTTILTLTAVLLGGPIEVNPSKAGMDPELLARIPARMRAYVDEGAISGSVTLILRHNVLASLDAVGYQEIESKKPMRADTIFEIFSMTKPVTAIGIMMLLEEGKLALSDPVEKYLPEFRGMWVVASGDAKERQLKRPSRKITVRDLLTHTSGLAGELPEGIKELLNPLFRGHLSLAEAVLIYSQLPLDFEPGTKWRYSNTGFATLGRIIEVIARKPYEQFMDQRIFQPLGMSDTFFFPPDNKKARIASLYEMVDGKLKNMGDLIYRKGGRYPMPEGGIYSTAGDLVKLYQAMLNGGSWNGRRLLSRASVDLMTMNHIGDLPVFGSQGQGWGLGWTVVRTPEGALNLESIGAYGHSGAGGTKGWVDPKKDMITLFLIQRYPGAVTEAIYNTFRALASAAIVD